LTDYFGFFAGALVTFSLIPQIIRVFKLKSAREISLLFNGLLMTGMILWLVYGALLDLIPVMLWNVVGLLLMSALTYAKFKYGR
jgi:MtN3 and saliva related transmembrane protein